MKSITTGILKFLTLLKPIVLTSLIVMLITPALTAQQDYYFPDETEFNEAIPTPEEFLGYPIGTHYTRHDRIVAYLEELARLSDRATIQEIGQTVQLRPQVIFTITSPDNHENLEEIRQEHLTLLDPDAPIVDLESAKSIISLAYSVHGNESSSGETALLTAYYFVAGESEETLHFLDEAVILLDPAQNPDGRDRAAHWHNSYKSFPAVADPYDIEHIEGWPNGRSNHFLHDLNRDWFAVTQQESQNRVDFYQQWFPNIQIDFHEMGTNSTYYLEPTQPERTWNPIIPEYRYEYLSPLISGYQTDALDELGALYWTKEVFDNISPIYGSTYPDILGGVGITFEVGSSRGLVQESVSGDVTFESTIKQHLYTGIATVRAGVAEKETLLEYQKDFFRTAVDKAESQPVRAYYFGDSGDITLTDKFLNLLLTHSVDVYAVEETETVEGKTFRPGSGFVVPTSQPNYHIVHDIFESHTSFADSVFYDITAWSQVQGYGIQYAKVESGSYQRGWGTAVSELPERSGSVEGGQTDYAYLLQWSDYSAPAALYRLLDEDLIVRSAHQPFVSQTRTGEVEFGYGSVIVAVAEQQISGRELFEIIESTADEFDLTFHAVDTGLSRSGIDLGSRNAQVVDKPEAAIVFGSGVRSTEAGEAWFLLNRHAGIGITKIDTDIFPRADLQRYNTIVLVDGNYSRWSEDTTDELRSWIRNGGVLITSGRASAWAIQQELVSENLIAESPELTPDGSRFNYEERDDRRRANSIPGVILEADIDPSNPIAFGVKDRRQLFIKQSSNFLKPSENPYGTVAQFTEDPLVAGFVNDANLDQIRGTAALLVSQEGSGKVILFSENPNFRSYWHTTSRLFLNAILFGQNVRV
ncbi:hypothetical protein DYD21_16140 [Rhodohalobacter sp. SW132]|uniref:M14 family metallopeptidase n=1 Tax=Rhodohalobacter sp. SW132 TaxID=2293433 RepID=UPI000E271224|nr:M14 family metallopeptidase [Rhodohalobacter sp. SW132]REL25042.1 hypothetical protein DYD21_16140 [Rhodohalobacter sp. SW132]